MSLLLWGCTFGRSEARLKQLQQDFVHWFRGHVTAFPVVQARLTSYLDANDADIWLITGSPQALVEQVYYDTPWLPRVNLIATQITRGYGGWVLTMRCLGHEKGGATGEANRYATASLQRLQRQQAGQPAALFLPASLARHARRRTSATRIVLSIAGVYNAARF